MTESEKPRYWTTIKWILLGCSVFSSIASAIVQIIYANRIYKGKHIKNDTLINLITGGFVCIFTVLLITNLIFMGTIIKMWTLMTNHAYLRKNETLMITRWVIDLIYTIF